MLEYLRHNYCLTCFSILPWHAELLCACDYVHILCPGCYRTAPAALSMVETLPHKTTAGRWLIFSLPCACVVESLVCRSLFNLLSAHKTGSPVQLVTAPVPARRVNPSWCFPECSNGFFTKLMIADYASYNLSIAVKRIINELPGHHSFFVFVFNLRPFFLKTP